MNDLILREARSSDINEILNLYNELIDHLDQDINYPKWTRDYYPNLDYLKQKLDLNELFVLLKDNVIVGSSVLNSSYIDDYNNVDWTQPNLKNDEILCVHTFAIKNDLRGQNLGLSFIQKVEDFAKDNNYKTIHLDTIYGNSPAVSFYEKAGYNNLGEYELHYDETDETRFILFEKDLI